MIDDVTARCIILGASHAGVNCAFALRKEGWKGEILLIDSDPRLPYHRPPLSKSYLADADQEITILKSENSYKEASINLLLGHEVVSLDSKRRMLSLETGQQFRYDTLVMAVGGKAFIPPFRGIAAAQNVFTLRNARDAEKIRRTFKQAHIKKVTIIGGGYIGLEVAASLRQMGAEVNVLEREDRILARVTAPEVSDIFTDLHKKHGVSIHTGKTVEEIQTKDKITTVICSDGTAFRADMIIIGVGIKVNTSLAEQAGLVIENGIKVNANGLSSDDSIYAIGDCSFHPNVYYEKFVRLESVQNAVDQAKVVAANICGKALDYNAIPWFWSDQYDVKLQIVGLSDGYTEVYHRVEEEKEMSTSTWYFRGEKLLAVDAINNAKAYVLATKYLKTGGKIDKKKIVDSSLVLRPHCFDIE